MEDLKALAKEEGLWNLCLPHLREDEPGTRLSNLEYAPLAESMGRLPWSSEVFNCSAPDSGNMELLQRHATPEQRDRWLRPLLEGDIRSAFAMSEPESHRPIRPTSRPRCGASRAGWCSTVASGSSPAPPIPAAGC